MNTFNKKSLYAALAGVGALGMAGAANAVNVNPDGLGQVLIYPYYTVRSAIDTAPGGASTAYNTLMSVVNSTASAKAVKVRFLEGKNSREVLDFNLYLSARDVWTASIVPTANAAAITTSDNSCTLPSFKNTQVEFVNYAYASDPAGGSLDRTREGYIEVIEMGDLVGQAATAATHVNGVPPCTTSALLDGSLVVRGTGGLFGAVQLVNVNLGRGGAVPATALETFRNAPLFTQPEDPKPTLEDASPAQTIVYSGNTATTYSFATGIDAVSAALMHDQLMNEIVLDSGTASRTDWVITFPTKRFYVGSATALPPFQRAFTSSGACDDVLINVWDREERTGTTQVGFSPPLTIPAAALCWEANVLSWTRAGAPAQSSVLGSVNNNNINVDSIISGYQNGWARLNLATGTTGAAAAHKVVSLSGATFTGLPVVGFSYFTYVNTRAAIGQATYGQTVNHRFTRTLVNP